MSDFFWSKKVILFIRFVIPNTVNYGIQVNFLSQKISTKLKLTSTVGLKFNLLPVEQYFLQLI